SRAQIDAQPHAAQRGSGAIRDRALRAALTHFAAELPAREAIVRLHRGAVVLPRIARIRDTPARPEGEPGAGSPLEFRAVDLGLLAGVEPGGREPCIALLPPGAQLRSVVAPEVLGEVDLRFETDGIARAGGVRAGEAPVLEGEAAIRGVEVRRRLVGVALRIL